MFCDMGADAAVDAPALVARCAEDLIPISQLLPRIASLELLPHEAPRGRLRYRTPVRIATAVNVIDGQRPEAPLWAACTRRPTVRESLEHLNPLLPGPLGPTARHSWSSASPLGWLRPRPARPAGRSLGTQEVAQSPLGDPETSRRFPQGAAPSTPGLNRLAHDCAIHRRGILGSLPSCQHLKLGLLNLIDLISLPHALDGAPVRAGGILLATFGSAPGTGPGMRYPVHPVKLPADLARVSNGKLPAKLLTRLSTGGSLHHVAARAWEAMRQAAAEDGVELTHVGAYRSYDEQLRLFRERYQTTPNGARVTRKWNGRTYYLRPGNAPSASPGTSNHGWGLAIDVAHAGETGRLRWLIEHAVSFGFSWEVADPANPNFEVWHLRYHAGSPAEVAPEPAPTAPTARTLRQGDQGEDVARLQWALTDAGYLCKADGVFGPVTDRIVRAFQAAHDLQVDGIVGPRTRAALGL